MASMASMVWIARGGVDAEVFPGAHGGGVDGWRRWMASMGGVYGGLGSSTQRAPTWTSHCVPSSDGDTHSCSFAFRLNSLQNTRRFLSLFRDLDLRQFAVYFADRFACCMCLRFTVLKGFLPYFLGAVCWKTADCKLIFVQFS